MKTAMRSGLEWIYSSTVKAVPQDIVPVFGLLLMDMPIVRLLLQQYLKQLLFDSALKYQRMMFTKSFFVYVGDF
jgi:hypothetical protein